MSATVRIPVECFGKGRMRVRLTREQIGRRHGSAENGVSQNQRIGVPLEFVISPQRTAVLRGKSLDLFTIPVTDQVACGVAMASISPRFSSATYLDIWNAVGEGCRHSSFPVFRSRPSRLFCHRHKEGDGRCSPPISGDRSGRLCTARDACRWPDPIRPLPGTILCSWKEWRNACSNHRPIRL